jgi:hypothetical protein
MAAMNRRQAGFSPIELLLIMIVIIGLIVIGWTIYIRHNPSGESAAAGSSSNKTACSISGVPEQFCARAKKAGYYCPSWDVKPGQVAPAICYKIP